jgi:hypothetical protein
MGNQIGVPGLIGTAVSVGLAGFALHELNKLNQSDAGYGRCHRCGRKISTEYARLHHRCPYCRAPLSI